MRRPPTIEGSTGATKFAARWLPEQEALRFIGRCYHTLLRWRQAGVVRCRTRDGVRHYSTDDLIAAKDRSWKRQCESYLQRGNEVGKLGGRPKHPGRPRIAEMLRDGHTVPEIVREVGCSRNLVGVVRREMREAQPAP